MKLKVFRSVSDFSILMLAKSKRFNLLDEKQRYSFSNDNKP